MALSRLGTTCTTWTKTPTTMILPTWSAYQLACITKGICHSLRGLRRLKRTSSSLLSQLLQSGTGPRKGVLGTRRTAKQLWNYVRHALTTLCALSAGRTSSPWTRTPRCAATCATHESAELLGSTTRPEHALSAGVNSSVTNIANPKLALSAVQAICEASEALVYNLTVADAPEYFANGVLAHNCDSGVYLWRGVAPYNTQELPPPPPTEEEVQRKLLGERIRAASSHRRRY